MLNTEILGLSRGLEAELDSPSNGTTMSNGGQVALVPSEGRMNQAARAQEFASECNTTAFYYSFALLAQQTVGDR